MFFGVSLLSRWRLSGLPVDLAIGFVPRLISIFDLLLLKYYLGLLSDAMVVKTVAT